jgi:hypothetical protein
MKNEMVKLGGFRKIYDLIYAWVDANIPQIYFSFDIDENNVLLTVEGEYHNEPIDENFIHTVEDLFLQGCELVDCDPTVRVYRLGTTELNFKVTTVGLLNFATDEGFVINRHDFDAIRGCIDKESLIDFILANPTFTIGVREDEVIVK